MDTASLPSSTRPLELADLNRPAGVSASNAVRSAPASRKSPAGSRLVLPMRGQNGNSLRARRYRQIATAIAGDCGGPDALSEATRILIRQAASLTLEVEGLQSQIVAGEAVDLEQLTRLSNSVSCILHRLGLKKAGKSKLTIQEYLAARDATKAAE